METDEKVYCGKCKWLGKWNVSKKHFLCHCPGNEKWEWKESWHNTWLEKTYVYRPENKNEDNDCGWFELRKETRWKRLLKSFKNIIS